MVDKELEDALSFYDENDYLQPFQCAVVVDELRVLSTECAIMRATLERLANDSHGHADDKSGVWHMANIAKKALARVSGRQPND
jgi:hypothetical protein